MVTTDGFLMPTAKDVFPKRQEVRAGGPRAITVAVRERSRGTRESLRAHPR
jgi:hypothetical protein